MARLISRFSHLFPAFFLLAGMSLAAPGGAWAATHHPIQNVTIEGMKFNPPSLTVHAGDTIVWKNQDLVPHTVTAADKSFDSKSIEPGKMFRYKAKKKGTFSYSCLFHPTMTATLVVE